jgi:hypothetical protein
MVVDLLSLIYNKKYKTFYNMFYYKMSYILLFVSILTSFLAILAFLLYLIFKPFSNASQNDHKITSSNASQNDHKITSSNASQNDHKINKSNSQEWLNAHNSRRNKRNLPNFVWDDKLSSQAKDVATNIVETGNLKHGGLNQANCVNNKCGQNISSGLVSGGIDKIVSSWIDCECPNFDGTPKGNSGHYSQAMWPTALKVGCATVSNTAVCNYNTGNTTSNGIFTKSVTTGKCGLLPSFCSTGQFR